MKRFMIVAFMLCALTLIVGVAFNIQMFQVRISSGATIKTVGVSVWKNPDLTDPLTHVDWGFLEPGENKSFICYVKNEGNTLQTLSLTTENWKPTNALEWISLSWNREGTILDVEESQTANLTLTVSPLITGITTFSFYIVIIGSGN